MERFKLFAGNYKDQPEAIEIGERVAPTPADALALEFNNSGLGAVARAVSANRVAVTDPDFLPVEDGAVEHFATDCGGGVSPVVVVLAD
jgi:hypothetical protein